MNMIMICYCSSQILNFTTFSKDTVCFLGARIKFVTIIYVGFAFSRLKLILVIQRKESST